VRGVVMTHDELLAKVETDQEITKFLTKSLMQGDIAINVARQHWFQSNALRAVVELHKPDKEGLCAMNCVVVDDDGYAWTQQQYPCDTIRAIENELNK
jgi:hypothetical protein